MTVTRYQADVAAAVQWMVSSPDRIFRAQSRHVEDLNGRCMARMCRQAPFPCLTRWVADEAYERLVPRPREAS